MSASNTKKSLRHSAWRGLSLCLSLTLRRHAPALLLATLSAAAIAAEAPAAAGAASASAPAAQAAAAEHAASAAALPASAPEAIPPRLPVEAFAGRHVSGVWLSPDATRVVALLNAGDLTALTRLDVADGSKKVLITTDNKRFVIQWARWVSNERILVSVRFPAQRYFTDTVEVRLVSIKADGTGVFNLTQPDQVSGSLTGAVRVSQIQDEIIDWMPEDGQHVMLALAAPGTGEPAVYKVNVSDGRRTMVQAPRRDVRQWFTDAKHRVRVGVRNDDGHVEVIERGPGGDDWRTLWSFDLSQPQVWPLGFGLDEQELYVLADHDGRRAVFAVRLDQPDLPRRLLLSNPKFDVTGTLLRSPANGEALGLRNAGFSADGEARAELWSPEWRRNMAAVDTALPGHHNVLGSLSADANHYVLYSSGNGVPPSYYIGDRTTYHLQTLGSAYPGLPEASMAAKRPLQIRARDGLTLDAFLTVPKGHAGGALPLVLLPHGGPQSRDNADFDVWTEFLANRRYAVLQVNFRGSRGQGRDFEAAGLRRWGMEMQDDLTDAVQWAVKQGIADPARVCIVGASYGGYAALMGLVKTPELYRCGVSFAGVTHLQDQIAYASRYIGGAAAAERQIGRFWRDREQLKSTSPALQAERIQVPVLLVHGSEDRSVPVDQGQAMAKALKAAGKQYRYLELEGGDHHLSRHSHHVAFLSALESFLDEQLTPAR